MVKLIIHCADIHIRNFQRAEEYEEQLNKFISLCGDAASGYERDEVRIVVAGDLVHSKNTISNELIVFASYLLRELEKIGNVVVIAGNHDLVIDNMSRVDTMTAIFETAKFENCIFLDNVLGYESGCLVDDNVIWALYSIYTDFARPSSIEEEKERHPDARVIGLVHGQLVGSVVNGYVADSGIDGKMFTGCDCVMAGHIHKRQVLKRGDCEIVYPSSLIQQTYGESVTQHGFAIWDVETMAYRFVNIDNDYSLYNIEIDSIEDIDDDKERHINL